MPRRRSGAQARCAWTVAPCGGVRTRGRGWTRPWGGRPPIRAPTHEPGSPTGIYDIEGVDVIDVLAGRAVERGVDVKPASPRSKFFFSSPQAKVRRVALNI